MSNKRVVVSLALLFGCMLANVAYADKEKAEQVYRGISPDVLPELAHSGPHAVGVKTIGMTNPQQLNLATQALEDRKLTLEVWYPAKKGKYKKNAHYKDVTRLKTPFVIQGQAYRKAKIAPDKKFPLIVVSHGYTGYRTLMFYLGEHLASHGFIVAAIDHTDSTNADVDFKNSPFSGFPSTLYNRSRDQQAVLNYLTSAASPFSENIDADNAGVIGYSMGGYGVLNTIGGCYAFTPATVGAFMGIKDEETQKKTAALFSSCAGGQYQNISVDAKWKAAIAMAPWGGQHQIFDKNALAKITTPILIISGDQDDISHYGAIKAVFNDIGTSERYLLTYQNARHNIAAHPAPKSARSNEVDFGHYWEASWHAEQLNAVNKHFALAMMNCHVKDIAKACEFLDLPQSSTQTFNNGKLTDPWKGFPSRYSTGMLWDR